MVRSVGEACDGSGARHGRGGRLGRLQGACRGHEGDEFRDRARGLRVFEGPARLHGRYEERVQELELVMETY